MCSVRVCAGVCVCVCVCVQCESGCVVCCESVCVRETEREPVCICMREREGVGVRLVFVSYLPLQIAHYEGEKISAARHGFAPRVNEAKKSIEQYSMARTEYEEKMRESSETIKAIRGELATLDEQLHTLRPGLKLDTLENRCTGEWEFGNMGVWGMGVWKYGRMGVSGMGVWKYGRMGYWVWEFGSMGECGMGYRVWKYVST